MKKLVLVAGLSVALAACGDNAAPTEEPAATDAAAPAETVAEGAAETASRDVPTGTFEYMSDGDMTVTEVKPDGTYTDSKEGEVIESGTWKQDAEGRACFTETTPPEGEESKTVCFTTGETQPDGSFTATPDDGGEVLTVKKTA